MENQGIIVITKEAYLEAREGARRAMEMEQQGGMRVDRPIDYYNYTYEFTCPTCNGKTYLQAVDTKNGVGRFTCACKKEFEAKIKQGGRNEIEVSDGQGLIGTLNLNYYTQQTPAGMQMNTFVGMMGGAASPQMMMGMMMMQQMNQMGQQAQSTNGGSQPTQTLPAWTCPACKTEGLTGKFCMNCGAKRP